MKKYLWIIFFILLFIAGVTFASGASYTLYSTINQNDSICNNLIGLYVNQSDYDPYNQYYVVRTGQNDYYLFYGANLLEDYKYLRYYGVTNQGYATVWNYTEGTGNNLSITSNGFKGVGNVEGSISSDKADRFKFEYVLTVLVILISIVTLFHVFHKTFKFKKSRGYDI